jgi:predicted hydrolase (HD superfamily)
MRGAEELRRRGYHDTLVRAILTHADYSGVPRVTNAEKTLFAVDELCGLVVATALVMPNRSLAEVTPDAVLRKMKSKGFARKVSRDDILRGTEALGVPLEEHVARVVQALQGVAPALGL